MSGILWGKHRTEDATDGSDSRKLNPVHIGARRAGARAGNAALHTNASARLRIAHRLVVCILRDHGAQGHPVPDRADGQSNWLHVDR